MGGTTTPFTSTPPMDAMSLLGGPQTPPNMPPPTPPYQVPPPDQMPSTPALQELHASAVHHSRLAAIMDRMGTILGGDKTLTLTRDPDGNVSVTHNPSTGGEKWGRVAQAALGGLAAGFQNAQGPGGFGKAIAAGTQYGMQLPAQRQEAAQNQATQLTEESQKNQLFKANMALLDQRTIAAKWDNKVKPIEWNQAQDANDNTTAERMAELGGQVTYVGSASNPAELADLGHANPTAVGAHMGANDGYIQHFTDRNGVTHFYQVPVEVAKQRITKPITLQRRDQDPNNLGKTLSTDVVIPIGTPNGQVDLTTKALNDHNNTQINLAEETAIKKETADTGKDKVPSEKAEAFAKANQANAAAGLDTEKTKQLRTSGFEGGPNAPYDANSPFDLMAMKMADGEQIQSQIYSRMPPAQKLQLNARAEALSRQKYGLSYDPAAIARENNFANDKKTQAYYKATGALLGGTPGVPTGVLDNLVNTAQAAGIGDNPATNSAILAAADNPISALLLKPERLSAIQAYESALNEAKRNVSTAAGNPLVSGSDSDLKLKQMDTTLATNVPTLSKIKSAVNQVKVSATAERNANMQNNRFLRRTYGPDAPAGNMDPTPPPGSNTAAPVTPTPPPGQPKVVPAGSRPITNNKTGAVVGYIDQQNQRHNF